MEILTATKDSAQSELQHTNIINCLPAFISYVTKDLVYTYANDSFLKFHKLTKEAVIGHTVQAVLGEKIFRNINEHIQKALNGQRHSFNIKIELPDGEHYFDGTYIPDINANGNVVGYTSFVLQTPDKTTELLRKNEELAKSEERYHKMVDEVENYAIILLDLEGNILDWNKGAANIKGYKPEEIIGQNFRIFYLPEDRTKLLPEKLLQEAINNGKAEHEGWRVKKDGTKFWGSIVITALHDDKTHNVIGFSKVTRDLTERKAAEERQMKLYFDLDQKNEELKRSEEKYHKMIGEVEDYAIILLDKNGYIQNWNKGAQNIKGYKPEEIIGKNFRIFYSAEDRANKLPETLLQIAEEQGKANHEGWRVKKDGTKFWGSIFITTLYDDEKNVIGFSKVTRDLTERKAAEEKQERFAIELQYKNEELRRSEEKYHRMIAEVEDYAIILLDTDGNILNWNKGAEKIKGYTTEEIIGRNFKIFYQPEDQASKLPSKLLEKAKHEGKAVHEGWRVKKDGSKFWGSIVITALHDDHGNLIGFSKVTRDLTERKIFEEKQDIFATELKYKNEQLRRSEERYHKMIAEVEDYAIILLNNEGVVQNWNKGAERIKGYKAEEIVGKSFKTFYLPEDINSHLPERLLQEARNKGVAHHEGWRMRKDGSKFWGSVVITALHDEQNNILGFSKVTRDLTERKLAEDKLKLNAEQLETQNKELEQFAYVASHDLQEPLRKIRTFNAMIIEHEGKNLSEKAKDYFNRSISAADRMNQLIEDLLTYSRATRDTHNLEPVNLNLIVSRIRSSYKDSDKKIKIESDDLPVINGMPFQFEQLFTNLIGNGIKYQSENNTPHIQVRYDLVNAKDIKGKNLESAIKYHHLSFIDNGIGFDEAYVDKIFEMFQRLHGRSEYSGSGIGLAIVKKIVQNYSGFITAESEKGKGSTFNVYIPE